ncbi:hypothetical protein DS742_08760 [Lacrimispora amygdalina]|uniref:Uncharacterized protein n=1 Tax=Lacrimispora amygdalina TaxID=253257 RepID=A0A3E2NE82_9FIRM|nr:hypothetical protein DS742_08760 [Clostridium indicum]
MNQITDVKPESGRIISHMLSGFSLFFCTPLQVINEVEKAYIFLKRFFQARRRKTWRIMGLH